MKCIRDTRALLGLMTVLLMGAPALAPRRPAALPRAEWAARAPAERDEKLMADHWNPGYPSDHTGALFNFSDVKASEVFDYKALGYEYDTLPAKK